jgi:hypothetical protein
MVGFSEAVLDARFLANAIEDMLEGLLIALAVGELNAVIGEHGVELIGHSGNQVAQELSSNCFGSVRMQLGIGKLAGTVMATNNCDLPSSVCTSAMSMWK